MTTIETLHRYNIIITRLRRSPASFNEIADELELESSLQEYDLNISKRTFQRDIANIEMLFGITIYYDYSQSLWNIKKEDDEEGNARLLDAFDTFNALKMTNRLPQFIDYEKRRPKGTENLNGLLQAIKNNQRVRFTYHKIWTDDTQIRYIEPLALKESINRWYVVACDMEDNKKIKTFALDRISEIINTSEKFIRPNDFDVNELFKYSFGIISGAHFKPEEVKLIFYKPEAEYILSLRLHHTQKETKETDDEIHFEMTLYITEDFIKEIVSHGSNVKVLKPNSLIRAVKEHHKEALDLY